MLVILCKSDWLQSLIFFAFKNILTFLHFLFFAILADTTFCILKNCPDQLEEGHRFAKTSISIKIFFLSNLNPEYFKIFRLDLSGLFYKLTLITISLRQFEADSSFMLFLGIIFYLLNILNEIKLQNNPDK